MLKLHHFLSNHCFFSFVGLEYFFSSALVCTYFCTDFWHFLNNLCSVISKNGDLSVCIIYLFKPMLISNMALNSMYNLLLIVLIEHSKPHLKSVDCLGYYYIFLWLPYVSFNWVYMDYHVPCSWLFFTFLHHLKFLKKSDDFLS